MAYRYGRTSGTSRRAWRGSGLVASCDGTASPTVALKPSGAFWFDARLLTSFQIEVCCASDRVSVSLAAVLLARDMWFAADAAVTPDSASVNASAAEMDLVISYSP